MMGYIYAENMLAGILPLEQFRQLNLLLIVCLIPICPARKMKGNLKYQTHRTNHRPANYVNSQSEKANSGHQSASSSQGVRYSDIVTGYKYNVPTANRYAPLN